MRDAAVLGEHGRSAFWDPRVSRFM